VNLVADCGSCVGLCCVAPALVASADFALTKPAGCACVHLGPDSSCRIHPSLIPRGFPGCVAYDCFGAGQRVVSLLGPDRTPRLLHAYEVLHQLHELLFYLADALGRPAAAPVHDALTGLRDTIAALDPVSAPDPFSAEPARYRARVAPLLRRASSLVRTTGPDHRGPDHRGPDHRGADLAGRDLSGAELSRADLSTASLLGASLRGARLRAADFLGADLRGADLRGADLTDALYLTRTQVGGTRGDARTILPAGLDRPAHWAS
jgi:Pentapeptide repeats (8 copies)